MPPLFMLGQFVFSLGLRIPERVLPYTFVDLAATFF
jgi:hypothetical protein